MLKTPKLKEKGLFWAIFRSILGENMAFFAKSRRILRTKNFEAHFHIKLRTLEKCSNVKKLRATEPQPIFTGSYKKKKCTSSNLIQKRTEGEAGGEADYDMQTVFSKSNHVQLASRAQLCWCCDISPQDKCPPNICPPGQVSPRNFDFIAAPSPAENWLGWGWQNVSPQVDSYHSAISVEIFILNQQN